MELNEKYFQPKDDKGGVQTIEQSLMPDEKILWQGKPQKKAFVLNNVFKMLPIALLWIAFDVFFIVMLATNADGFPTAMIAPICIFFVLHLAPVWIWIYKSVTASKRHKNTDYAFTDKRIIIRKGTIAVDFKSIEYKDVVAVNLRYGVIDRLAKVGDIYITATGKASVLEDLENPSQIAKILQDTISQTKQNVPFTDNAKVTFVKCKYCGCKNKSTDTVCSSCGAPLE